MSRYLAILEVDDEVLQETEEGSLTNALEWCCDSGVRLQEYVTIMDDYKVPINIERSGGHLDKCDS